MSTFKFKLGDRVYIPRSTSYFPHTTWGRYTEGVFHGTIIANYVFEGENWCVMQVGHMQYFNPEYKFRLYKEAIPLAVPMGFKKGP